VAVDVFKVESDSVESSAIFRLVSTTSRALTAHANESRQNESHIYEYLRIMEQPKFNLAMLLQVLIYLTEEPIEAGNRGGGRAAYHLIMLGREWRSVAQARSVDSDSRISDYGLRMRWRNRRRFRSQTA
jgi:hypothetical protein